LEGPKSDPEEIMNYRALTFNFSNIFTPNLKTFDIIENKEEEIKTNFGEWGGD